MAEIDGEKLKMQRWLENLWRDMGKLLPYMRDKTVTDIFCLESGEVVVSRVGKGKEWTGVTMGEGDLQRIIFACASVLGKKLPVGRALVKLEGVLPKFNARITAVLGDCVRRPLLTLRCPSTKTFSLDDYVEGGRMTAEQREKLLAAIVARRNILISGSTGSGKTTLFNAVIAKMAELTPDDHFYIVEDVPELVCNARLVSPISVPPSEAADAVRLAMRMTPDRILFGELRYGEVANELLKSWNTGHTGNCTTIHADSAASSISRVERLLEEVITGKIPDVREAIHLCVHLTRKAGFGPIVDEVLETDKMS